VTGIAHPSMQDPAGHLRDFGTFDRVRMLEMYDSWFVPNNATLVLVGAITTSEATALARRYFGLIPRGAAPAEMDVEADPPPGGAVRLDWLEPAEPRVIVRYRIPGTGHPDHAVFDVIARLIGGDGINAGTSRYGMTWPLGAPTVINISASARTDAELPTIEQSILARVEKLRAGEIDEAALTRVKREFRFDWELVRADRRQLAAYLGRFTNANDAGTLQAYLERRDATTARDIQRVANEYLVPWNRVIGTTRRNPEAGAPGRYLTNPEPTVRTGAGR
jgi:zinc protease